MDNSRPTPRGSRRRPPGRETEARRPSAVYRQGIIDALRRMSVLERLREDGFRT